MRVVLRPIFSPDQQLSQKDQGGQTGGAAGLFVEFRPIAVVLDADGDAFGPPEPDLEE
ncbi:MAG: hypothetical protein ABEN55_10740 [Bradymonadaceae bacterium]